MAEEKIKIDKSFNLFDESIDYDSLLKEIIKNTENCLKDDTFKNFKFIYAE